jgi:phosphohistidine swiveling domain-containing protein
MSAMPPPSAIPLPPDFPVEWQSPEERMLLWEWDHSHFANQFSPLGGDLVPYAAPGFTAGLRACGLPLKAVLFRRINTYLYQAMVPDPELVEGTAERVQATVRERGFTIYRRWLAEYLPEVEAANRRLIDFGYAGASDAELAALLDWALERFTRMWEIHFLLMPGFYLAAVFKEACARLLDLPAMDAYEMMQGAPNLSVESGSRLWRLAHAAPAGVKETITALPAAAAHEQLGTTDEGRAFLARLDEYLQIYGWRKGNFDVADPSWVEAPSLALDHVRLMLRVATDPAEDQQRGAARAEALADRCRARLAHDPAKLGEFNALYAAAKQYPQIQENHNFYIDQKFLAVMRLPFMEVGRRMTKRGLLDRPEDVAFLHLDEVRAVLAGDATPRQTAAQVCREEMARWRSYVPPAFIGARPPVEHRDPFMSDFFGARVEPSRDPAVITGLAAARGMATGTARVIRSLAEAGRVQEGDILVCEMTTPAWTPLFAGLAGIVADSGGPLSHCAVVAREYGVPCVVGTRVGTRTIPDGTRITVDGTQGIVRIDR